MLLTVAETTRHALENTHAAGTLWLQRMQPARSGERAGCDEEMSRQGPSIRRSRSDRRRALSEEIARPASGVVGIGHSPGGRTRWPDGLATAHRTPLTRREPMTGEPAVAPHVLLTGVA